MSGVSGSNRISRENFDKVLEEYKESILKHISGFKSVVTSGSYNSDKSKMDFGDMDLIVQFDTELSKKEFKKNLAEYFNNLPDDVTVPFTSEKYSGKKYYNSGEIVTINFPQPDGTVQIDNIIALDEKEMNFKKEFLDMPAEKQGLVLGLIKVAVQESGVLPMYKKINEYPALPEGYEAEFNLSSSELQLRAVKYDENFKQVDRYVVWSSKDWNDVLNVLSEFNLDNSFEQMITEVEQKVTSKRSLQRIVGVFKSMVSVKSGEVGTTKGDRKEQCINIVESLTATKVISFKQFLNEKENTVGIFVGRFQPLTLAHTDIIETISKENKKGIIFLVKAKKVDKEKSPFDEDIQRKLLEEVIPDNIEVVTLPSGFFVDYINELPENTFTVYAGTDRVKSYERFSSYMNEGKTLTSKEIKRGDDDISATKVRESLKENDEQQFKTLTDSRIHKYFKELKTLLG